jgi:ABC-type antimicrobial peptide transport system permease subunit
MPDLDNIVYVPLSTYEYRFYDQGAYLKDELDGIELRLREKADSIEVAKVVTAVLDSTHRGVPDFTVTIPAALLAQQQRTQTIFTYVMVAIAAISLLVGGIGVMNIMLVSVTERTREIGVRMATGARMGNILLQFNTEALVVCGIGGLVGVALGIAVALTVQSFGVAILLSPLPAILAFSCAFLTGLLFGYLPARKAAQMDPVVALSYE